MVNKSLQFFRWSLYMCIYIWRNIHTERERVHSVSDKLLYWVIYFCRYTPTLTAAVKAFLRLLEMLMSRASLQVIIAMPAVR